jgi:hypothetical protein
VRARIGAQADSTTTDRTTCLETAFLNAGTDAKNDCRCFHTFLKIPGTFPPFPLSPLSLADMLGSVRSHARLPFSLHTPRQTLAKPYFSNMAQKEWG